MKKLIAVLLFVCFLPAFAFADGFGMTVTDFIQKYNERCSDKPIEDIANGKIFGSGETQYVRLKVDDGVEIFLRYSYNVDSELSGIIIMQKESKTDFEKLLHAAVSAAYVLSHNVTEDFSEVYYQPYKAVCEAVSYYGYNETSISAYAKGYVVQYGIDDGTRQIYIAPINN